MADLLARLRATRALLEGEGWTQGTLVVLWNAGGVEGCAYCLDGAILAACGYEVLDRGSTYGHLEQGAAREVVDALHPHLPDYASNLIDPSGERPWSNLFLFNDDRRTTQGIVLAVIDRAIAHEESARTFLASAGGGC